MCNQAIFTNSQLYKLHMVIIGQSRVSFRYIWCFNTDQCSYKSHTIQLPLNIWKKPVLLVTVLLICSAKMLHTHTHTHTKPLISHRKRGWFWRRLCSLFCFQHITHTHCFLPAVYHYLGLICSTLANLCCLMSSGMACECSRLLFGPGDVSRAYSCISLCLWLSLLPESLPWPRSLESLPGLAIQSAFRLFFIIFSVVCWTVGRSDRTGLET